MILFGAGVGCWASVPVQIGQNFTAGTLGVDSFFTPPDCNGAVGPNHFAELINGRFSVFSKATGAKVTSQSAAAFWTATGITFGSGVVQSDPRLIYDATSQRWFASAIDVDSTMANNRFLLAVSATADPTGNWQGVAFTADPAQGNFADFPTLGLDQKGVYLGGFYFSPGGNTPVGDTLVSIPKADLLANLPTADNRTWFGVLDPTLYGYVPQPAVNLDPGATGDHPVLAVGDLGNDLSLHFTLAAYSVQNADIPGGATLSATTSIGVSGYSIPLNPPQPGGNTNLDDGDARFGAAVRQVGDILYATHASEVNGRAAVRWYRISATNFSLLESGTISDSSLDLFYPSINANQAGTVAIVYNGCSSASFVSIYASVGETVNGVTTFGDRVLLKAGNATYQQPGTTGVSRWGDYSTLSIDAADPSRFWSIHMYPSSASAWSTQVTELITGVPSLSIARSGGNVILSWPGAPNTLILQQSSSLGAPNWTTVTQSQSTANGVVSVTLPIGTGPEFFRLQL